METIVILQNWQAFLKRVDQTHHNVPNALSFTCSGRILITYSLYSGSNRVFGDIEEALHHVDEQMKEHIKYEKK